MREAEPNGECLRMLKWFVLFNDFEAKDSLETTQCYKAHPGVTEGVAWETWYKCWVSVMKVDPWQRWSPSKTVTIPPSTEVEKT